MYLFKDVHLRLTFLSVHFQCPMLFTSLHFSPTMQRLQVCMTMTKRSAHQARNQLGTPGGTKSFRRGAQIF